MERMISFALEIEENNKSEMIFKKIKNYHTKFIFQKYPTTLITLKRAAINARHATSYHNLIAHIKSET
jgi:hypothetical protein